MTIDAVADSSDRPDWKLVTEPQDGQIRSHERAERVRGRLRTSPEPP